MVESRARIKIRIEYETDIPIDEWQSVVKNDIRQELSCCTYAPDDDTLKIDWERIKECDPNDNN